MVSMTIRKFRPNAIGYNLKYTFLTEEEFETSWQKDFTQQPE